MEWNTYWALAILIFILLLTFCCSSCALCSWGANMSKKIAEASSVDFHT